MVFDTMQTQVEIIRGSRLAKAQGEIVPAVWATLLTRGLDRQLHNVISNRGLPEGAPAVGVVMLLSQSDHRVQGTMWRATGPLWSSPYRLRQIFCDAPMEARNVSVNIKVSSIIVKE